MRGTATRPCIRPKIPRISEEFAIVDDTPFLLNDPGGIEGNGYFNCSGLPSSHDVRVFEQSDSAEGRTPEFATLPRVLRYLKGAAQSGKVITTTWKARQTLMAVKVGVVDRLPPVDSHAARCNQVICWGTVPR